MYYLDINKLELDNENVAHFIRVAYFESHYKTWLIDLLKSMNLEPNTFAFIWYSSSSGGQEVVQEKWGEGAKELFENSNSIYDSNYNY